MVKEWLSDLGFAVSLPESKVSQPSFWSMIAKGWDYLGAAPSAFLRARVIIEWATSMIWFWSQSIRRITMPTNQQTVICPSCGFHWPLTDKGEHEINADSVG